MRAVHLAAVLFLAGWVSAEANPHMATVKFSGASTLHNFEGTGASDPFELTLVRGSSAEVARVTADATLPVGGLTTAHASRDKNMMRMFEQAVFPAIHAALRAAPLAGPGKKTQVPLVLVMHGRTNTLEAGLSDVIQTDGDEVSFDMTFEVKLDAFGMKPPSVLGLIRVDNLVKVDCRIQPYTPPR